MTDELSQHDVAGLLRERAPLLALPVGLPGAGKSALARTMTAALAWPTESVISTDALRTVIGGRRDWLHDERLVFDIAQQLAKARLKNGLPVYFDATNVHAPRRTSLLDAADRFGRTAMLIRMDADPLECRNRREPEVRYEEATWVDLVDSFEAIDWGHLGARWVREPVLRAALDRMSL